MIVVDWSGREVRADKPGTIPTHIQPILQRLGVKSEHWSDSVQHYGRRFYLMSGSVEKFRQLSERLNKSWLHGVGASRRLYIEKL